MQAIWPHHRPNPSYVILLIRIVSGLACLGEVCEFIPEISYQWGSQKSNPLKNYIYFFFSFNQNFTLIEVDLTVKLIMHKTHYLTFPAFILIVQYMNHQSDG